MKTTIAQQLKVTTFPFVIKDKDGKIIYREDSDGFWSKIEYDGNGNEIRFENSNGYIVDKRPKVMELTLQQIADKMGIKVEQLRIKD
jgi:hypothetical protein